MYRYLEYEPILSTFSRFWVFILKVREGPGSNTASKWRVGSGPHQSDKQDPDPQQSDKKDPDPNQSDADPQHWHIVL